MWGFFGHLADYLRTNHFFFFLYNNRLWNGTDLRSSVYMTEKLSSRTVRDDDADSSFGLADPHLHSGRLQNFADKFFTFFFLKNTKEQKEKVPHTTFNGMKFIKHFFLTSTLFIPCCCCSVGQTWRPYRDPPLVTKEQKSTNKNILFGVFDAVC